jgi:8-oxo-dGTP diphosphatase
MISSVRVVAAVFIRDGRVLACRRRPELSAGGRWEFPGGKIETGETGQDALRREIAEELGVQITVERQLDSSTTVVDGRPIELHCYLVADFEPDPVASTDHDQLLWCPADRLADLAWAEPDLPAVRLIAADLLGRAGRPAGPDSGSS